MVWCCSLWIVLGHVMYFLGQGVNWTNHRAAYGFYGKGFLGTLPGLLTVGFYFAVDRSAGSAPTHGKLVQAPEASSMY